MLEDTVVEFDAEVTIDDTALLVGVALLSVLDDWETLVMAVADFDTDVMDADVGLETGGVVDTDTGLDDTDADLVDTSAGLEDTGAGLEVTGLGLATGGALTTGALEAVLAKTLDLGTRADLLRIASGAGERFSML